MDLAHRISDISLTKFNSLPKKGKPLDTEWTVLSTISQYNTQSDSLHIVSLGTGTKCLTKNDLNKHPGTKIHDSHAEIIARRAFLSYIFEQIRLFVKCKTDTIFEKDFSQDGKLKIRKEIQFHFFTTHLPCGDASISQHAEAGPPEAKKSRLEERIFEDGFENYYTGARLISPQHQDSMAQISGIRTKPGRGVRTLSVSCSDKLFKWNLIGIQGALLSTLIADPIYLKSFTLIGYTVESATLSLRRALVERYESKVNILRSPFKLNSVAIHVLPEKTFRFARSDELRPCPSSIVWSCPNAHEVSVEGKKLGATKKQKGSKGRLLISKIEIFRTYLILVGDVTTFQSALFPKEKNLLCLSYDKVKSCAKLYNEQWSNLIRDCIKYWTIKPENINKFTVD